MKGLNSLQDPWVVLLFLCHLAIVMVLLIISPSENIWTVFSQASLFGYSLFGLAGFWDYFTDARHNIGSISDEDAGNVLTEMVIITSGIIGLLALTIMTGSIINPLFGFPRLLELSTIHQLIVATLIVTLYVTYDLTKFDDEFIGVHHWNRKKAKKFAILFMVIDLPVLISLIFLIVIVITLKSLYPAVEIEALIGGAFAFELIVHNSAFTLLEAWPLIEWIDELDNIGG